MLTNPVLVTSRILLLSHQLRFHLVSGVETVKQLIVPKWLPAVTRTVNLHTPWTFISFQICASLSLASTERFSPAAAKQQPWKWQLKDTPWLQHQWWSAELIQFKGHFSARNMFNAGPIDTAGAVNTGRHVHKDNRWQTKPFFSPHLL